MELSDLKSLDWNISTDIFPSLLDWFFDCDAFQRWQRDESAWQLHCIGGPGSGKTTFARLASQHLSQKSKHHNQPVISVSIDEDISDRNIELIEAFLLKVYEGLDKHSLFQSGESDQLYKEYRDLFDLGDVHPEGAQRRKRLRFLRNTVHTKLEVAKDTCTFVILDGIDRCGPTIRYMLETELVDLQEKGAKILLTSRSATFQPTEATCDYRCRDNPVDTYLQCRNDSCKGFTLCFDCNNLGRVCGECNVEDGLHEPYDHVNIRLWVPPQAMETFIAWDLEREHGDLGLNSPAHKPPLSALGESLLSGRELRPIQALVERIAANSYGNIGIARARLEQVHEAESAEDLEARKEQLPAPIVALFDCGLESILAQPKPQREVALNAIVAAARYDDGEEIRDLLKQMRDFDIPGIWSGEEIVEATRGWLVDIMVDTPQRLKVYNNNFLFYVEQNYHRALHQSSMEIEAKSRRGSALSLDAQESFSPARIEPKDVTKDPQSISPYKLTRTVTAMPAIEEAPAHPSVVRQGTVPWK